MFGRLFLVFGLALIAALAIYAFSPARAGPPDPEAGPTYSPGASAFTASACRPRLNASAKAPFTIR